MSPAAQFTSRRFKGPAVQTDHRSFERAELCFTDGTRRELALDRWASEAPEEERRLLDRVLAPVLDIGCGPGRHVVEIAQRGLIVLGIDTSPAAIAITRERGGPALERSIFSSIPGSGRWMTALLMDGNIGIGGDPLALLYRTGELLSARGRILVELDLPDGTSRYMQARIERAGVSSAWFPWATVSVSDIEETASSAGFHTDEILELRGRWFAFLSR